MDSYKMAHIAVEVSAACALAMYTKKSVARLDKQMVDIMTELKNLRKEIRLLKHQFARNSWTTVPTGGVLDDLQSVITDNYNSPGLRDVPTTVSEDRKELSTLHRINSNCTKNPLRSNLKHNKKTAAMSVTRLMAGSAAPSYECAPPSATTSSLMLPLTPLDDPVADIARFAVPSGKSKKNKRKRATTSSERTP
ncbi:hypothetical protein [Heliothis virescens ascovirus 3e]|uniref:Uncharacterized protein n=2 Tax=Ascovirus hvav3a TaxID=3444724 RepID=A4KXJ1_HVAVE|nr:hypothetical protein HVAV3e_gp135 [Heliothis virescens ascovirus 3e]ABO37322.1 hypothetical protein [Heliothis virescens ascovirus 3e]